MATTSTPATDPNLTNTDPFDNPLRAYRSYSYHFILVAADTTEILSNQAALNDITFYDRPEDNPRGIKTMPAGLPPGRYSIVIDGRRDTDFIIQEVEFGTDFVGNSNSSDSTSMMNTFSSDGTIQIVEPRGVKLINVLAALGNADQLNMDISSIIFLLKVIFVGHKDDGSVEQITNIPPFGIVFKEFTSVVDATGTTYNIPFANIDNGAAWSKSFDAIVDGIPFTFGGGNLQTHLDRFNASINETYEKIRQRTIDNLRTAGFDTSKMSQLKWNIVLDTSGGAVIAGLDDFGTNAPMQYNRGNSTSTYTGTKEGGVGELISRLFSSSKKWQDIQLQSDTDASKFAPATERYQYKITSKYTVSSNADGSNVVTLTYIVSQWNYKTINVTPGTVGQSNFEDIIPDDEIYTFNYLFTGKNVDIINMNLAIPSGYTLWQQLAMTRAMPTPAEDVNGTVTKSVQLSQQPPTGTLNPRFQIKKGSPILPSGIAKDTFMKEYRNSPSVGAADAIWRQYMNTQIQTVEVAIHGNPNIIQKLVKPSNIKPNWVKINIKMPTTSDDIWEYNQRENPNPGGYYEPFWYTGLYLMQHAKNKFSGGQFTQELSLQAMSEVSSDMENIKARLTYENDQTQVPSSQFAGQQPPADTPNLSNVTPPAAAAQSLAPPTNTSPPPASHTAFVIRYWNQALASASSWSATYGTPQIINSFIIAQAALESGWGTSAGVNYFNFFGFKGAPNQSRNFFWDGAVVAQATHEASAGQLVATRASFRVYSSAEGGMGDYVRLISQRYGNAAAATTISDYAYALQNKPGGGSYATDPNYSAKLISVWNQVQTIMANALPPIIENTFYEGGQIMTAGVINAPFIPTNTVPYTNQVAATPTKYSAWDRTIQDASIAQKTQLNSTSSKA